MCIMASIEVRQAEEGDLRAIIKLWQRNIKTINTATDIAKLYRYFGRYFLIAVDRECGAAVGFVAGAAKDGHAHISGIAVERRYRRQGVGSSLMKNLHDIFQKDGFKRITLEVRKSNRAAILFYESLGFKPCSVIWGYYADGEDAIVYEKEI